MQINFRTSSEWSNLNEHISEYLNLNLEKNWVRVYQTTAQAIIETVVSLSKNFPLKKKLYYLKKMDPAFEAAIMLLAKEGFKVVELGFEVLDAPDEWSSGITKEDLFVLYSADDSLFGKTYDLSKFEKSLNEKNLFQIRVSNARHFYEGLPVPNVLNRNSIQIFNLGYEHALTLLGERARVGSIVAGQLNYQKLPDLGWVKNPRTSSEKLILDFESKNISGAQAFFKLSDGIPLTVNSNGRIFDRAVIYWPDMDGYAFIDRLAKKLNMQLQAPGFDSRLETTSLSRWGGVRTMDFLAVHNLSPEQIRGLVILSSEIVANPNIVQIITQVRNEILADQMGETVTL